jgi:GT2 family glycosyltransferase
MVALIIPSLDGWDKYVFPLLKSIKRHEPDARVILVDNASEPPYPKIGGIHQIRLERDENYGLARASNVGIEASLDCDWFVILHNDMLFTGLVSEAIQNLDPNYHYSAEVRKANGENRPWDYGIGRPFVLSKQLIDDIGLFDEAFWVYSCEDVDYSWRATQAGYPLKEIKLNILHSEDRRREKKVFQAKHIKQIQANEAYLQLKHNIKVEK